MKNTLSDQIFSLLQAIYRAVLRLQPKHVYDSEIVVMAYRTGYEQGAKEARQIITATMQGALAQMKGRAVRGVTVTGNQHGL